jgi:hypothetical protein
MSFYKCVVKAGHDGGCPWELTLYLSAKSYTEAMKQARWFPAVKHNRSNTIMDMQVVDEDEFILGSVVSAYSRRNELINEDCLVQFKHIVRRFNNFKVGKLETEKGKILKDFVNRYNQASAEDKTVIEQEYYNWAQSLVDSNQLVR